MKTYPEIALKQWDIYHTSTQLDFLTNVENMEIYVHVYVT